MENFEHQTRQQLEQYESPINTAKMWAHIDAELRPAPKHRIGWLWMSLGIAGALATWLVARQYQRYIQVINTNPYTAAITIAPKVTESIDYTTTPHQLLSPQATTDIVVPQSSSVSNYNVAETPIRTALTIEKTQINAYKILDNSEKIAVLAPTSGSSGQAIVTTLATTETSTAHTPQITAPNTRYTLDILQKIKLPSSLSHEDEKEKLAHAPTNATKRPDTNCYDWRPKPQLYGGVYAGASYPFKSLQARKKEDEVYADVRKKTESVLESVQGGVFIGVMTPKKIFIEAGLEYNRINERFRTSTTTTDTIARYEVIGWIIKPNGDTTFVRDSVLVTETTTTGATIYNNFQFYNIPIALGYEFGSPKARFRPYIKGGVAINIAMPYKSGVLDPLGDIQINTSSSNTNNTPYRTRIGSIPFAAFGARMSLHERVDAFGELNYRYHLQNVTLDSYLLQQRYSLLGLNIGLSMRF